MTNKFSFLVIIFALLHSLHCSIYADSGQPIFVKSALVTEYELFETVNIPGLCKQTISRDYYANVAGVVDFASVNQGGIVSSGELLIGIDQKIAKTILTKDQADYDLAKNAHERNKKLLQKQLISLAVHDNSTAKLAQAEHQLSQSRKTYNDMIISAPFDGQISVINVSIGESVKIGDYLFTIIANGFQEVVVEIPESLHSNIHIAQKVKIIDYSQKMIQGEVSAISPLLSKNGTLRVKIALEDHLSFTHGSYVNVEFTINKHRALVVPEQSVMRNEQGSFVYKIIDSKTVKQLYVTTGTHANGLIEINADSGLKIGDLIVLEGLTKIQDGSKIQLSNS